MKKLLGIVVIADKLIKFAELRCFSKHTVSTVHPEKNNFFSHFQRVINLDVIVPKDIKHSVFGV